MDKSNAEMMMHNLTAMVSNAWAYSVKIDIANDWYTFTIHDHGCIVGKVKTDGNCVNLDPLVEDWPDQALAWAINNRFVKSTDRARFNRTDPKTKRREDVKELWIKGETCRAIAEKLFYSESTVKRDLDHLGLTNKRKGKT